MFILVQDFACYLQFYLQMYVFLYRDFYGNELSKNSPVNRQGTQAAALFIHINS